jgi:signal transduction histidine kinase
LISDEQPENRLAFETLISDLSSRFNNLPPGEVDRGIEDALRRVSEFLAIDFAIIWQWSAAAPGVLTPTHAYVGGDAPRPSEPMTQDQHEYPWVLQEVVAGRTVVVPTLDALPEEAAVDRESAQRYGIRSNLTIPLSLAGELPVGVLGLNTVRLERDWPEVVVQRLQLIGQVFTNALARSRSEEERQRSAARLAAGAELAGLAFYEVDLGEGVAHFDGRLRDLVGLPPDREQGLRPLEFWVEHLHPDDRQRVLDARGELHEGLCEEVLIEYRFLHPAEGEKWLHHLAGVARRGTDGRAVATYGVLRDVSERHQVAEETRQKRAEIAHLSRVALAGELSGSLAHEINQPLGAILSNAQALRRLVAESDPDLGEIRAIVEDIIADDQRASEVIVRLRHLLRRGQGRPEPEDVDLHETVRQVLRLVRRESVDRGVRIQTEVEEPVLSIRGDSVQMQQVFLNLVLNAFEAMSETSPGSRLLSIRIEPLETGGARASVSDTGSGIAAGLESRIFEPFVTTKPTGMGMGLAICWTIVRAHGGTLEAANDEGGGATFSFTLPGTSPPT